MRDHRPKSTTDLLASSKLQAIQKHASELANLNQILKPYLPKGTEALIRVANIRHGCLMLEVASAAIKMKIEYERLAILSALRKQGFARLIGIDIKINPEIYRSIDRKQKSESNTRSREISSMTAEMLTMVASHASPKVKQRLENIAKLAKK